MNEAGLALLPGRGRRSGGGGGGGIQSAQYIPQHPLQLHIILQPTSVLRTTIESRVIEGGRGIVMALHKDGRRKNVERHEEMA